MKRIAISFCLAALALAGCGGESTDTAPEPSPTSEIETTSSVATAVEPAPALPSPAPETQAAETPEPEVPESTPDTEIPTASDMPHGEALYAETCQRFIVAIDGLAATGAVSREQSATGLADQLRNNPSWSTIPPEDQQEILRGLTAAGNGSC